MSDQKKIIYSLAFGNFAASVSALIVAGISSEMAEGLAVSIESIGHLVTVFAIVYALSSPVVAALTGKVDRRSLLVLGMLAVLLGNAMVAISTTYNFAFVGRIMAAIGAAIYTPLSVLVGISLAKKEEQGRVSSIIFTGSAVATALGLPLGTFIGIRMGWTYPFWGVAVLAFLSLLCMQLLLPKGIRTAIANFNTLTKVLRHKALLSFLAITVLQFGGQMVLFAFISPWLKHFTSLQAGGIATLLVLVGVGGILGNIITGKATDKHGARSVQLVLMIALILIMPTLVLIEQNVWLGGLLFFLWGLVGQGFVAPQLVRIVSAEPTFASASLSLNSSFINVGIALGALLAANFVSLLGIASLTWVALGVVALSFIVFLLSWNMGQE